MNEQVFSQQYDPQQPAAYNVTQVPIQNFFTDLENDALPFYSFIMRWNDLGSDYDPIATDNGSELPPIFRWQSG